METVNLFARTDWARTARWFAFRAGAYNESHAHQDQGGFTLFANDWLAVTENIWSHSGIQQGTETHNVVRFENGGRVTGQCAPSTSSMTVTPVATAHSRRRPTSPQPIAATPPCEAGSASSTSQSASPP